MSEPSLRTIAIAKGTDKQGAHSYADLYERHLAHLRDRSIVLLEIGIGGYADPTQGGASLRMWKEYFPHARIVGLDKEDKSALTEDRITIVRGSQADKALLEQIAVEHGPFDVVIDDGSHQSPHIVASFEALFPHLRDDGIYVIEDLQTSYWETYGGSSGDDRRGSSMTLLHGLADGINHAEYDIPGYEPTYTDRWVTSVAFYHNIAFIQKGPNDEGSHLLPPHPRAEMRFAKRTPAPVAAAARKPASVSRPRRIARAVVPFRVRLLVKRATGRRGGGSTGATS